MTRPVGVSLPVKGAYTAKELSKVLGLSRHLLRKLLRLRGVQSYRIGSRTIIPVTEIRDKLEPLWASIVLLERAHGTREKQGSKK